MSDDVFIDMMEDDSNTPPAEHPTPCVSPVSGKDACVSNYSENDTQTEPPTPDVKPMGAVTICRNGYVEALECDLAAVSAQRDALALDAEKWEALHDEMADAIEFEIRRDNHGPLETHAEAIARVIAERDALARRVTDGIADGRVWVRDIIDKRDVLALDAARLDFLQANHLTAWRVSHDEWVPTTESLHSGYTKEVFDGWVVREGDEPNMDIRAAIDAAMERGVR